MQGAACFSYEEMSKRIDLKMGDSSYDLSVGFAAWGEAANGLSFTKIKTQSTSMKCLTAEY